MADKLIVSFEEYIKIVEKLAIEIHNNYKPTVLVGIMRGAAPIIDILSRILKLPIAIGSFRILERISIIGAAPLIIPTKTVGL